MTQQLYSKVDLSHTEARELPKKLVDAKIDDKLKKIGNTLSTALDRLAQNCHDNSVRQRYQKHIEETE